MNAAARSLSWWDTVRVALRIAAPAYLLGLVAPNRPFIRLAAWLGSARGSARLVRELQDKYGCDHLWVWFPLRRTLLVLDPRTIDQVLDSDANAPDPALKKRVISRFAPGALVISNGAEARDRRPFNTDVLALGRLHGHAGAFAAIVADEASTLITRQRTNTLRWADFERFGERVSHQVLLGSGCVRPEMATQLGRMVRLGNLLFARDGASFAAFHAAIEHALDARGPAASSGCLMHEAATSLRRHAARDRLAPSSQAAFWFFVLKDAVELHVARTLALVAAHPDIQARAREELRAAGELTALAIDGLRYLEACIAESLRLWTPVPLLLRRAERRFEIDGIGVDTDEQILFHAGAYHRDPRVFGERADAFSPDPDQPGPTRYVFSAHGRSCAGASLVMFVLKAAIASLLARHRFELVRPVIQPGRIPVLVDHYAIELRTVALA